MHMIHSEVEMESSGPESTQVQKVESFPMGINKVSIPNKIITNPDQGFVSTNRLSRKSIKLVG